jgi:hypothetical protein
LVSSNRYFTYDDIEDYTRDDLLEGERPACIEDLTEIIWSTMGQPRISAEQLFELVQRRKLRGGLGDDPNKSPLAITKMWDPTTGMSLPSFSFQQWMTMIWLLCVCRRGCAI